MTTHPDCTIRAGGPGDAAMLADLGARAFSETFAKDNTPEDLAEYLRASFSPEIQAAELARPGSHFVVLECAGQPVGFARLLDGGTDSCLQESAELRGLHSMELIRIYLLQAHTGRRLGDVLMQACLEHAAGRAVEVLWLGVWEHNPRAIAFYQRWGFEKIGEHDFPLGQDIQTDWVMARRMGEKIP